MIKKPQKRHTLKEETSFSEAIQLAREQLEDGYHKLSDKEHQIYGKVINWCRKRAQIIVKNCKQVSPQSVQTIFYNLFPSIIVERIIQAMEPFISQKASEHSKNIESSAIDFRDLISVGREGLLNCIVRFDYRRGNKLITYATYWIDMRMRREIRDRGFGTYGRIPEHLRPTRRRIVSFCARFKDKHNRWPEDSEVAQGTGLSLNKVASILVSLRTERLIYVEDLREKGHTSRKSFGSGENDRFEPWNTIASSTQDTPEGRLMLMDELNRLKSLAGALATQAEIADRNRSVQKPKERTNANSVIQTIARDRLMSVAPDRRTLKSIGDQFGYSRERIRQMEDKVIDAMAQLILSEFPDYIAMMRQQVNSSDSKKTDRRLAMQFIKNLPCITERLEQSI